MGPPASSGGTSCSNSGATCTATCPTRRSTRHTGPAAQMVTLDDYNSADFDSVAHGFVGGASLNVENQQLPLQIARDPLPSGVRGLGPPYQQQLRRWQHIAAVRIQPDSLAYTTDHLDLDPRHRDRSGLGLPVLRVTTDMRPNEHRLHAYMEEQCVRILERMGAVQTWPGPRLRGCGQQPRPGRRANGRRPPPVGGRPGPPGPRHARAVRVQRRGLPHVHRGQPAPDADGTHRSRHRAADRAARSAPCRPARSAPRSRCGRSGRI